MWLQVFVERARFICGSPPPRCVGKTLCRICGSYILWRVMLFLYIRYLSSQFRMVQTRKRQGDRTPSSKGSRSISKTSRRSRSKSASPIRRVLFASSDTSVQGSTSSNTPRRTIEDTELHLWKQVAEDIEENGGIAKLAGSSQSLKRLLDKKNNPLYDRNGDKNIRKRIQSHVYRWQQWSLEGTYEKKVLDPFGVKSALRRQQEAESKQELAKKR